MAMTRATRKTPRKPAVGTEQMLPANMSPADLSPADLPTSRPDSRASDTMEEVVLDRHAARARSDMSRLSQTLEPMTINNNHTPVPSEASSSTTVGEAHVLGADVVKVKAAIATMTRLQGLGFERYHIPVPKCIILGEQSTGKSSVIEAISGIKTPRADGTCTRCPLYIQLEPAKNPQAPWQARVRLRSSYRYDGQTGANIRRKFPGWTPEAPTEIDFGMTTSPDELEVLISRAQLATLSGGNVDSSSFMHGPLDQLQTLYQHQLAEFSPNCVCIYVTQPGLPSLSFYDLPGIIGQAEDQATQFLVKFVRDLVTDYIRDKETLILVTCSLDNDIHNSTAAGIAREENATDRCVGVLTKPDCLPPGGRRDERLLDLLRGKSFRLGNGYFVVKNLSQDKIDQGLTNRDARAEERSYFATALPWASPRFQDFDQRFGTGNLQTFLSKKLAAQTIGAIPNIRNEVARRLQVVEAELRKLPDPPSHNAIFVVQDMLRNFTREVELEMAGEPMHNTWRNTWDELHAQFFENIMAMKPKLRTRGERDQTLIQSSTGKSRDDSIVIDSEDEDEDSPSLESSPTKKRKMEGSSAQGTPVKNRSHPNPGTENDFAKYGTVLDLDEVATSLKNSSKSKIPGELNPKVLDGLIMKSLRDWRLPMDRFFLELHGLLRNVLRNAYDRHFAGWKDAEIFRTTWRVLEQLIKCHFDEQANITAPLTLNDELKGPFIFHKNAWETERAQVQEHYAQSRFKRRQKLYFDHFDSLANKTTSLREREIKVQKDERLRALLHKEPYAVELGVAAKITSYYQIASRRFHESICMRVESKLFEMLKVELLHELANGLDIAGPEGHQNCVRLLADNPVREARRAELIRERNALLEGQQLLDELVRNYGDDSMMSSAVTTPTKTNLAHRQQAYVSDPHSEDEEMVDAPASGRSRR